MLAHALAAGEIRHTITGPTGALEIVSGVTTRKPPAAVLLVCHPHPLQQGTMHNKVVTTAAKVGRGLQLASVRFNFRGVGESQGHFDQGAGETEDALAVVNWIKARWPSTPILLAGFSFGAYVALCVARQQPEWGGLICIAPPVERLECPSPWQAASSIASTTTDIPNAKDPYPYFVIQGQQDEVVSATAVQHWAKQQTPAPHYFALDACHYFHGQLLPLQQTLTHCLATMLGKRQQDASPCA